MRQRITNLVDELHWQLARWLTSNYRIILLPTFETHDMTQRAGRRIRSKTARMMLTFRHYEFKRRLKWKAWQRGALVLDVNEAYTSKTRSWDGAVNTTLGGAKAIRDDTGFGMDRDINGARGIFLRALGDSPLPAWLAHAGCIATNTRIVERWLAFNYRSNTDQPAVWLHPQATRSPDPEMAGHPLHTPGPRQRLQLAHAPGPPALLPTRPDRHTRADAPRRTGHPKPCIKSAI